MDHPEDGLPLFLEGALADLAKGLFQRLGQAHHGDLFFPDGLLKLLFDGQMAGFHQLGQFFFAAFQTAAFGDLGGCEGLVGGFYRLVNRQALARQVVGRGLPCQIGFGFAVPDSGGKQSVGCLKKGTEIPPAHPQRQRLLPR